MAGIVLVTGGSRGIGAAVSIGAAARGWAVCLNYRKEPERARQVVEEIKKHGGKALAVQADVAVERDVVRLFETVDRELGPLKALVNNAGIVGAESRVESLTAEIVNQVLMTNVTGCFLCAREAVKRMSTKRGGKGGSIVNVSSVASRLGGPGRNVHYAASKGAVDSFTLGLAREVADEGIRVNAVSPGVIDTEIQAPGRVEQMTPLLPMKRPGRADEVAAAILFLMSDDASYVSAALMDVSGAR
jgi:NAD(P)-dependent dehydrogenase (short-subunit alcohol dehydrogenase family)